MQQDKSDQNLRGTKSKLSEFDPDFSPSNPVNTRAAERRGLRYNPKKRAYVDSDGCLIRDRFGQPY